MAFTRLRAGALAGVAALAALTLGSGQALAAGPRTAPPPYTVVDLGTLGGANSTAAAVDADTVVGSSQTAGSGIESHAFAYDRATHVMTDLGTLGGRDSVPIGLDGRYVAGDSTLANGDEHGFIYDLSTHVMTDLGGANGSGVTGIGGSVVIGSSRAADQSTHAFAYDASTHVMTDLGTLAGPSGFSTTSGISKGRYIAGTSSVPGAPYPVTHAFVYDLRTHVMTDLGANGGTSSAAYGISGHTVVGTYQPGTPGGTAHGFAYDLRTGTWTDLGDRMAGGPRIDGHLVVATDGHAASVFDLTTGTATPFGPGLVGTTDLAGLTGRLVVGDTFPGPHAFAYRVNTDRFITLPELGGPWSTARSSDDQGTIAGISATSATDPTTGNNLGHAVLWVPRPG